MSDRLYTAREVGEAQYSEATFILKGLLRNLTEVREQQSKGPASQHRDGVIDGLNIAIAAVRRRIR